MTANLFYYPDLTGCKKGSARGGREDFRRGKWGRRKGEVIGEGFSSVPMDERNYVLKKERRSGIEGITQNKLGSACSGKKARKRICAVEAGG